MKKLIFTIILICSFCSLVAAQDPPVGPPPGGQPQMQKTTDVLIPLGTKNINLVFKVIGRDGRLYQSYLGAKLGNTEDIIKLRDAGHIAYATYGTDNLFEPAIRMTHNDGNPSLELKYVSHQVEKVDDDVTITHIKLKDPVYPVDVTINFKTFSNEDVIEQWVEIMHHEAKPVTIFNYASSMLHLDANKYFLTQFHGNWAEEMRMQESELTSGIKIIDSKLGSRAHMYQTPVFFLSLNGKSGENNGDIIAGTLGWSGNFQFLFEVDEKNSLRVISGINPFASEYSLQPGKSFVTPSMIFTFSNQGKGLASRNLQHFYCNLS